MANYEKPRVKPTNANSNPQQKIKTGTTLRITKENFQDEELPHELFLTRTQKTKIKNAFAENISTHIKFTKAKIPILKLKYLIGWISWLYVR